MRYNERSDYIRGVAERKRSLKRLDRLTLRYNERSDCIRGVAERKRSLKHCDGLALCYNKRISSDIKIVDWMILK